MKKIFILILFVLSACDNEQQVQKNQSGQTEPQFVILALGDSLTEGLGVDEKDNYPSILQSRISEKSVKVINAGLSGETTSGLKNRLNWVLQQKPKLTILTIGANDAMRGIPLDIVEQNLNEIIQEIKNSGSDVILAGMQIYENLGKDYVSSFKDIYPRVAKKQEIPLIPFFLEHIAGIPKYNQSDLLHPNAEGYQIIVEQNILPIVEQYLKDKL